MQLDDSERADFAESVAHIDGQRVIHLGPVDHRQKSDLLKDAAGFLFPIQREELFGLVMIEAMACGTPVVALRRGSVEEVVDLGKTGYYGDSIEKLTRLVRSAFALDRDSGSPTCADQIRR
jgi:glycosyltransferase involved in cell wall biosynthesis